jgi:hypothetical protein
LLAFPEKYQKLSLDPDPQKRIPSNFWIELFPVLELCEKTLPQLTKKLGRDGIIGAMIVKYRNKRIKSVIHFRRIMEAYEVAKSDRPRVLKRLEDYVSDIDFETRTAFDEFVVDNRRVQTAVEACRTFIRDLDRLQLDYTLDRKELRKALEDVASYAAAVIQKLEGGDPPEEPQNED